MSGLLATTRPALPARLRAALARLTPLGHDERRQWSSDEATVCIARNRWELDHEFSGPVMVLETPTLVLAADASLYYRDDLLRALNAAGVHAAGGTSSHFIAAAYDAWGLSLVDHLAGDFAFALWDRNRRRLVAARDPLGSRPLFFSRLADGIAVASSSLALAELRGSASALNLACLGAQVAGLAWSIGTDSAYAGVEPVPPGHRLVCSNGKSRLDRFWRPPVTPDSVPSNTADAADELRSLLCTAVAERLSSNRTTVWMSGGWDSTAVFAAGQHVLAPDVRRQKSLQPVSISYPAGDPGHEDELIAKVAAHWDADVHWLQSDAIPLLDRLPERAARSDEPPAHLYELWNRELARGTRAAGSRVALDGGGGDQLFQLSDVILAERLQSGQLREFARLALSRRERGWRHLIRAGVLPLVPEALLSAAERASGRHVPRHYLERSIAEWVQPGFVARHQLRERDLTALRQRRVKSVAQTESMLYLTLPVWSHGASFMRGALLREGVEARSPLLDLRIVEFALRRPVTERAGRIETKTLLRTAMKGLLPAEVLAPRKYRTGMTVGFSRRRMREAYPGLVAQLFSEPLRLAELGIVDPGKLRVAADRCIRGGGDDFARVNLFHAMKVEFWLRGFDVRAEVCATTPDESDSLTVIPAA